MALAGVIVIVGLAAADAAWSLYRAKQSLDAARTTLNSLQSNRHELLDAQGRYLAALSLIQVGTDARSAAGDLDGVALKAFGLVPYLHAQRNGLVQLVNDLQTTTTLGHQLIGDVNALVNHSQGTSISLPALAHLGTNVATADHQVAALDRPVGDLVGPLRSARSDFDRQIAKLHRQLSQARRLLSYVQVFLGSKGPRTYLVVGENNAEMRDQGAPLSAAVMTTKNGSIAVGHSMSIDQPLADPPDYPLAPGIGQIFGFVNQSTFFADVNQTADFAWTGGDLQAMAASSGFGHVDGVIAIDVPTMVSLLNLTGPIQVTGVPEALTAQDATDILLNLFYRYFPVSGQDERHDYLSAVATDIFHKMQSEHLDIAQLANALDADLNGRHLLLWDSNPSYERLLNDFGASGEIDNDDPTRTFHIDVENGSPNKLDYFVTGAVHQSITLTALNNAVVNTTVTVRNLAPVNATATYQFGPVPPFTYFPGQYVGRVFLWGPRNSIEVGSVTESGLPLLQNNLDVFPGHSVTFTYRTVIPNAVEHNRLKLVFIPQPRLIPETVQVHLDVQGWHLHSAPNQFTVLTATKTLEWSLTS